MSITITVLLWYIIFVVWAALVSLFISVLVLSWLFVYYIIDILVLGISYVQSRC